MALVDTEELDKARKLMYDELKNEFGEENINNILQQQVVAQLERMYDNKDQTRQQLERSGLIQQDNE